jgi:hypothetical protein
MTIDEAVKLLKDISPLRGTLSPEDIEAIRLSIEALKAVKHYRSNPHLHQVYRLEGETEA